MKTPKELKEIRLKAQDLNREGYKKRLANFISRMEKLEKEKDNRRFILALDKFENDLAYIEDNF